jgi:hypothetical protein|tara:strand:- start:926 stop:1042 length:117 start_codon:yes stop_codon:yes gene_type:complete
MVTKTNKLMAHILKRYIKNNNGTIKEDLPWFKRIPLAQ